MTVTPFAIVVSVTHVWL